MVIKASKSFRQFSLKARITAGILLLLAVSFFALTATVERRFGQDMVKVIEAQQDAAVTYVAADVEQKVHQRIELLSKVAEQASDYVGSSDQMRDYLSHRPGALVLFPGGMIAVEKGGATFADFPVNPLRQGARFNGIDFFEEVIANGKTVLSRPRISRFIAKPGAAVAAPIRDPQGNIWGVLVAFVNLTEDTFLGHIGKGLSDKNGLMEVVSRNHRMVIYSSDPDRILKQLPESGLDPMMDRFLSGFEGAMHMTGADGRDWLMAGRSVPSSDWIVLQSLPGDLVFAPLARLRDQAYGLSALLTVLTGFGVWLVLYRGLNPLNRAARLIREMAHGRTDLHAVALKNSHGEVRELLSVFNILVEQRVHAEAELRSSTARLQLVLQTAGEGVFGVDEAGKIIFANRTACELLGWPSEHKLLGTNMNEAAGHHLADGRPCYEGVCAIRATLADGQVRRVSDECFKTADRRLLPVEYVVARLELDGKNLGAVVVFHDESERRSAKLRFDKMFAYQRAILDNSPAGIAIFSGDRRISQVNNSFCRIFQRSQDELVGSRAEMLYRDASAYSELGQRAYPVILAGETFREDISMMRKDGAEVWIAAEGRLIDVDQPELGVVWVITDATQRRLLEDELRRSNEELERFAYVASHDLRQPLRMISSYLTLVERMLAGRLSDEERECLDFAVSGAKRMDRMIIDLLDYSRIGRIFTERTRVSLDKVLTHVRINLAQAIEDAQARLEVTTPLPDISGYESEIERLLQNLIANAIKFHAPERPPVVTLSCAETSKAWLLSVADNGIGIEAKDIGRLFQIFQRLVSREQYEGTGIGLASCRKIAEHHGGKITVESELGQGTVFTVTLPKS